MTGFFEHGNESLGFLKAAWLAEKTNNLLKKDNVPCSVILVRLY